MEKKKKIGGGVEKASDVEEDSEAGERKRARTGEIPGAASLPSEVELIFGKVEGTLGLAG